MITHKYRTRVVTVTAVQWTGDNIAALQDLLAPASPLWTGEETTKHVGVMVDKPAKMAYDSTHELQHADVNDWIVKYPSGRVAIVKQAHFEEYFEPEERPEFVPLPNAVPVSETELLDAGLALGDVAGALVERQPETEQDDTTVSER